MFAALALAGALALFLFGAFQPVAAQTTSSDVTRSFNTTQVATGGSVEVTITLGTGLLVNVTETLPDGWTYVSVSDDDVTVVQNGQDISFDVIGIGSSAVTYTVTAPDTDGTGTFSGTYSVTAGVSGVEIGGPTVVTVGTGGNGGNGGNGGEPTPSLVTLSTDVATEGVRIELEANSGIMVPAGEDLTVTMEKFGLPSSIPESSVLILGTTSTSTEPYSGEPAEVRIEAGNKVVLSLTSRYVNGDAAGPLLAGQDYSVVFKKSAGITNPNVAGKYSIQLNDKDATDHSYADIEIMSKIKLSKTSGPRGTVIEATALGMKDGDTTFYLQRRLHEPGSGADMPDWENAVDDDGNPEYVYPGDGYRLDKAPASGGKATVSVNTTTQNFVAGTRLNAKEDALQGLNVIRAVDGAGNDVDITARFEVTPLMELDGDSFKRGGKVDITVSDWVYGTLNSIDIGAVRVTEVPRGGRTADWSAVAQVGIDEYEFSFIVPNDARLGEQELKLIGSTLDLQGSVSANGADVATGKILVGAFDLTIDPSTAVTGQVIRIEGTGFEDNACIAEISIGGDVDIDESTSGNGVGGYDANGDPECSGTGDNVEADSNGNLADTFIVPGNLKAGTYRVTVVDVQRRVGIADLTVPEPKIELDPAASQRGSTVAVIGSNFPAEDVITIAYRGRTVTAANTDTVGRFRGTFAVPVNAPIGEEHEVEAISADKADGNPQGEPVLKAKTLHRVPDEILEVTPEVAAPGTRITITASNLPLYTPVSVSIGNVGVAGHSVGELAESDGNGKWSGTPLVPQLTPGTHTVEMTVGRGATGISVSTFLEIADIITRASEEAFEDLIDNGTMTRVWYLDRATQTWSFFDPAPEFADFNTLEEVSTGQIVTIIMNAQDSFQGSTLFVGSNPTVIE